MTRLMRSLRASRAALLALCLVLAVCAHAGAQTDPLPSWNDGPAKQAILEFVRVTTDKASPKFVAPEARIAAFDQDGTHLGRAADVHAGDVRLHRVGVIAREEPKTQRRRALQDHPLRRPGGDGEADDPRTSRRSSAYTHSGMTVEAFKAIVQDWLATAKHPRFKRPYHRARLPADARSDAVPARERVQDLYRDRRRAGFRARVRRKASTACRPSRSSVRPPTRSTGTTRRRKPSDQDAQGAAGRRQDGKPGIHLMIGRRPVAAFGNSTGDQQMLEYTQAGRRRAADDARPPRRRQAASTPTGRSPRSAPSLTR